jgi:hypothetical protein
MTEPWFEPSSFGAWWGAIVGGGGGSLVGLLGSLTGWLLPRGIGRRWFLAGFAIFALLGLVSLIVGLVALFTGQAYGIWYAFLLTGVLFMVICMGAIFYIRRVGHQLE